MSENFLVTVDDYTVLIVSTWVDVPEQEEVTNNRDLSIVLQVMKIIKRKETY